MPSFLCLTRQRENVVRENINPTTGQELELIRYTRAAEKVTAAKNVGKIILRGRREGGGQESTLIVAMHK